MEKGGAGPRHEVRVAPGNEVVQREDRGEGKPLRNAVIPRGVKEVGRRVERLEKPGKRDRLPANPPIDSFRHANRDRIGYASVGHGPVREADELDAERGQFLEELPHEESNAARMGKRERPEIDGDANRSGHARTLREPSGPVNDSAHPTP